MARARNIKPGFFRNADLVELPMEARLLFIGLWTLADRCGRLEDRPKQIKMDVFPADSVDCDALLSKLAETGMVVRYAVNGSRYLQVVNFAKHQNPHRDEKPSTLPDQHGHVADAEPALNKHHANTVRAPCKEDATTVAIGLTPDPLIPDCLTKEKTPAAPAFVLPEWIPVDTWAAYLQTRKAKKAKNEPHALGLIVKDLADIRDKGHDPIVVLNNSIKSGWAGVFMPKTLGTFAQAKAEVAKSTVSLNPDVEATRRRVEADAAIPRNGPTLAVLAQMAALRGQRLAA